MNTYISTNKAKIVTKFFNLVGILATVLIFVNGAFEVQAAPIAQYTGGIVVYADGTTGTPKYKTFDDTNGFGSEQSATAVGSSAIEWVRVAASPTRDEWIIATRDAADDIIVQVCTGVDGGLSCGATTTITATAGAHGFRNFDVSYEKTSGDALLVYGTATADELRKIEWNGTSWTSDAAITTTRTSGTVEWVELTSRNASDQIGIAYADDTDDVSAYRWSGTAAGDEATAVITADASNADVRKFDISFEGVSGDMVVAAPLSNLNDTAVGHMTAAGTWTIVVNTLPDRVTAYIDLQEPGADNDVAMVAHGSTTASNPSEGYELDGTTPAATTGIVDGTIANDTTTTVWATNYMMTSVAYHSSTYYAVGIFSDVTGADDINWWTMSSAGVWTAQTDNTRTRGTVSFTDIFDYPNADKVLLFSSDANSDLWADTWLGTTTGATAWIDRTSAGAVETALSSATTDVYDFAFRLSQTPSYLSGVLYTDAGVTTAASGKVINMAVGTSTLSVHTATTTSGGAWTFEGQTFSTATSGTPFILWLDGDASDANTLVTGFASTSNLTGIPIYYDYVMSYASGTTDTVDLNNFAFYDSSDDADLLYTVVGSTATSSTNLFIKRGIFVPTNDLVVAGNYQNNGTLTASTSEITFTGSSKTLVGNMTGTSAFYDLTIKGSYTISSTTASTTNLTINTGGSLTAPSGTLTIAGDYTNNGTFVENSGTITMDGVMGSFASGRNSDASTSSTNGAAAVLTTLVNGNYLYVGTSGSSTPCTQVAGSADGCEIQVYDISNPESPVYVAGRDAGGSATGAYNSFVNAFAIKGNYLYVGQEGQNANCYQTVGNAEGCELTVYDISVPTNPTFVTSIDHDGSLLGLTYLHQFKSLAISGNYLYAGKFLISGTCSQVAGSAGPCELMVFDISNPTSLTFVAGRDADGSSSGTNYQDFYSMAVKDSYLYVAIAGDAVVCSQTAGSAEGCELQVYNIASGTNPVYVAGRDAEGNAGGSTGNYFYDLAISGNYLYVASAGSIYDCGQTAGSAYSCELQVYNISSSTNPVFVAGRDLDGSSSGNGADDEYGEAFSVAVSGNYLYMGYQASSTPCSQAIGSATGCELQTYDISSSSNPVYVAGRDSSGSSDGTGAVHVFNLSVADNYLYAGKYLSSSTCSQTAGGADGCELMVFHTSPTLAGDMVSTNDLNHLNVEGVGALFKDDAITNNLTITEGLLLAPAVLTVEGNYLNNGTFNANDGEVIMAGTSKTIAGNLTSSSTFVELTVTGSYTISSTTASTTNLTINTGGSLTAPSNMLTVAGNFENNGTYTHNSGTLDMNPATEILQYLGGQDSYGIAGGTNWQHYSAIVANGNYIYVGTAGETEACAQTVGNARGCEIQVYDVSSSTNPVYVGGRDASGNSTGVTTKAIQTLHVRGNYLYVGTQDDPTACSQTAGSAIGCELMVFDISSSTNPTYVAGRDASGDSTGTGGLIITVITSSGDYLYVGKGADITATACSQTAGSAIGCELMVFDISSSTNPTYVAGRDASGDSTGVMDFITVISLVTNGNYLYVGKIGGYGCDPTPGLAESCELQVYDISTPTTPTLVGGQDSSGSTSPDILSSGGLAFIALAISGNSLYVGQSTDVYPCSQSAGFATGCELKVFDISSSTSPVFIKGINTSGVINPSTYGDVSALQVSGDYLYLAKYDTDYGFCEQSASLIEGCGLMVFDISSTSNPIFAAGRYPSGAAAGYSTGDAVYGIAITNGNVYVAQGGGSTGDTACSQTAGLAIGCELQVYRATPSGLISGTLTGSSALNNLTTTGKVKFLDTATTSNLTINSGTTVLPDLLTVKGNYTNNALATFSPEALTYFDSNSAQAIDGTLSTTSAFGSVAFLGSGTKTLGSVASTSALTVASGATLTTSLALSTTKALTNNGTFTQGSVLELGGNFHNGGTFNDNSGTIKTQAYLSDYLAGRDSSGLGAGSTSTSRIRDMVSSGNYLYIANDGSDYYIPCSSSTGQAEGCALQVYDVSSSTNPVYVAGRDATGSVGFGGVSEALAINGNYLYVGQAGDFTACSQAAGFAEGCELQVYDISSSTNPVYVAGRDADGSAAGANGYASFTNLFVSGDYLYVGKQDDPTACSQVAGSAIGCELQVYDISSSTNPTYVAGRDMDGSASGVTDMGRILTLAAMGDYLYIGQDGNYTACSQTVGSAEGCEIQVYNISTPTNPVYVAGRDAGGSATGTENVVVSEISIKEDTLYISYEITYGTTYCEVTIGLASGCELQVYDISSSTNPVLVNGRDAGGIADIDTYTSTYALTTSGDYLYLGMESRSLPCYQTAGFASGCELQVYDISSTTNPVYVTGQDVSGSKTDVGTSDTAIYSLLVSGDYLYVGKQDDPTTCSQTAGLASGCELMIFGIAPVMSGDMVGSNNINHLSIEGAGAIFRDDATVNNFTVAQNSFASAPSALTVAGNYTNNGTFNANDGLVTLTGTTKTIDGNLTGSSTLADVVVSGSYSFSTSTASTSDLTISGSLTAPATALTVAGNYTNNGSFADNSTTLYFDSEIENVLGYISGRDSYGSSGGGYWGGMYSVSKNGNYLYITKSESGTACSQTAGSAEGCELQVYDVSSTTNPVYVAGRDSSGTAAGTDGGYSPYSAISGNTLYLTRGANGNACSQTTGSGALGCELQVYDISSTTNPTYVAGRDADGSLSGTAYLGANWLSVSGNYLYMAKEGNGTACSQTAGSAVGCEIMVFDISSSTNPTYVAGRDAAGSASGSVFDSAYTMIINGNYLYVGKDGSTVACSQAPGGAEGCELMIFNIASTTNPVYVGGRDIDASLTGVEDYSIYSLNISESKLFVGKEGVSAICYQTAGGAEGCELQVYDISSSTNPTYVAGRDASGIAAGSTVGSIYTLVTNDSYLYVGKLSSTSTCSQTIGGAIGCELMVFDISSTTNPTYVAGRDGDGAPDGVSDIDVFNMVVGDNYLYVVKEGSGTTCSQTVGSAEGCELMVFSAGAILSGSMTSTNDFDDIKVSGAGVTFVDNATVSNLTIENGVVVAPSALSVSGDFSNDGTFDANSGTVTLNGTVQSLTGTTTFYNLTKNATGAATTTFEAGSLTTVANNFTFSGLSSSARHALRSSVDGEDWYLDPQGTNSISYLDVKDSYNTNVAVINCGTGCLDSTGNTNWTFSAADSITSASDYHFYVGQATTTLDTITLIPTATAANNLRLSIATTTTNFRFNTGTTNLTFGGTASGKVSGTVSYENSGETMVIDVTTNFAAEDTLTIDGIAVGSFAAISTTTSYLTLQTDGNTAGTPAATDTKTIRITGSLLLEDAAEGQVSNEFSSQNKADEAIYTFALTANNENATVTDIVFTLSGLHGVESSNIGDFKLYRDVNGNQLIDGGDVLLDGAGILTINGQNGAITFSSDFVASTTGNYMVTADLTSLAIGDFVTIQLMSTGVTALGATSLYSPYKINSITSIQHGRNGSGGGGSSARIGDAPPSGAGEVTGGEEGGGGGAGEGSDGENIAADSDYFRPTATGGQHNEWTNGSNALASDGTYATAASTNLRQSYTGFGFGIPSGNTIQGIAVKLDTSGTTAAGTIDVAISWDGGSSYTSAKATPTLSGTDVVYSVGGGSDTWGRSWSTSEFSTGNFILRVTAQPSANTIRLDALEIRVYHQTGGGGAGGGGGI